MPTDPKSTWQILLSLLGDLLQFVKRNWSGFAVMFWNYEERKVDEQRSKAEAAALDSKQKQNTIDVLSKYSGRDPSDVLLEYAGPRDGSDDKPGGGEPQSGPGPTSH